MEHTVTIGPDGQLRFIYDDALAPLLYLGTARIERASHVEPTPAGNKWAADMRPSGGPVLGPYDTRSQALAAEVQWLKTHKGL